LQLDLLQNGRKAVFITIRGEAPTGNHKQVIGR
jgi:hypothetical protein